MNGPDPAAVEATFTSVAPRYDLANHWLSGGIDFYWRNRLVKLAQKNNPTDILDLATGSGDVLFALRKGLGDRVNLTGLDFCEPMLEEARKKRTVRGLQEKANQFLHGDCLALPFGENSFDLITIAFGLRNVTRIPEALASMKSMLKPGGRVLILEFSHPVSGLLSRAYDLFSFSVIPPLGRMVTGDEPSYRYLVESIRRHPDQDTLAQMMSDAGLEDVAYHNLSGGIVAVHTGFCY